MKLAGFDKKSKKEQKTSLFRSTPLGLVANMRSDFRAIVPGARNGDITMLERSVSKVALAMSIILIGAPYSYCLAQLTGLI